MTQEGLNFNQLREYVVKPVLKLLEPEIPYSQSAENLILGTIAQESHGRYLHQLGKGPAVGICQMEPNTHNDIWNNYLKYHVGLFKKVSMIGGGDEADRMAGNLYYAVAMCRLHYRRVKQALPAPNDVESLAKYWKNHYNTLLGAGTEEEFESNYNKFVQ